MSFGFGISDIITITELLSRLINRVRTAPQDFRDFETRLRLVNSVFQGLQANRASWTTMTSSLQDEQRQVIQVTLDGIASGLRELEERLNECDQQGASRRGLATIRFAGPLPALRDSLDLHMSSLDHIAQTMMAQWSQVGQLLSAIRDAQLEQNRETIDWFRRRYAPSSVESGSQSEVVSTTESSNSRDELKQSWQRRVQSATQDDLTAHAVSTPNVERGEIIPLPEYPVVMEGSQTGQSQDEHERMAQSAPNTDFSPPLVQPRSLPTQDGSNETTPIQTISNTNLKQRLSGIGLVLLVIVVSGAIGVAIWQVIVAIARDTLGV